MSNITTRSAELQLRKIQDQVAKNLTKWVRHFANGSDENIVPARIPNAQITTGHGLKDQRLFVMKKHVESGQLGAILMLQIKSLITFLNIKNRMNEDQIGETARLILDDFDDMSFTSIMDCFNKVKTSKPPFNDKLYESIDGRKLLEFLTKYREYQTEFLENAHKDHQQQSEYNMATFVEYEADENGEVKPRNQKLIDNLKKLSHSLRMDSINKRESEKREKTELDLMVQGWILEFDKLKEKDPKLEGIGQLDLYLKQRMEQYNKSKSHE